jgi:hypothetical protein
MCKEILVILVNRVVDSPKIIGKMEGPRRRRRGTRGWCPPPPPKKNMLKIFLTLISPKYTQ